MSRYDEGFLIALLLVAGMDFILRSLVSEPNWTLTALMAAGFYLLMMLIFGRSESA